MRGSTAIILGTLALVADNPFVRAQLDEDSEEPQTSSISSEDNDLDDPSLVDNTDSTDPNEGEDPPTSTDSEDLEDPDEQGGDTIGEGEDEDGTEDGEFEDGTEDGEFEDGETEDDELPPECDRWLDELAQERCGLGTLPAENIFSADLENRCEEEECVQELIKDAEEFMKACEGYAPEPLAVLLHWTALRAEFICMKGEEGELCGTTLGAIAEEAGVEEGSPEFYEAMTTEHWCSTCGMALSDVMLGPVEAFKDEPEMLSEVGADVGTYETITKNLDKCETLEEEPESTDDASNGDDENPPPTTTPGAANSVAVGVLTIVLPLLAQFI